jgi:hypothetical protein
MNVLRSAMVHFVLCAQSTALRSEVRECAPLFSGVIKSLRVFFILASLSQPSVNGLPPFKAWSSSFLDDHMS